MRTKTFDCVDMKHRIQSELIAEYEEHKDQFSSYADFIHRTSASDYKIQTFHKKNSNSALKKRLTK